MIDIKTHIKANIDTFFPKVLNKLIVSVTEKKISTTEFLNLLSTDYSFEEKLIDYINRNRPLKVGSVAEASEIFGTEYCSFAVMNIALFELSGKTQVDEVANIAEMELFTAIASHIIAKKTGIPYPHQAYIAGLFSNISYFYLVKYFPEEYLKIMSKNNNVIKRMNYEWETFGIDHAEISYVITGSARLSSEIYIPVSHHHQKNSLDNLGVDHIKDISLAVYFGSLLTNLFYEDLSLTSEFKKDIKKFMGIYSYQIEEMITEIIDTFKHEARSLGIKTLMFPGLFKIMNWFDNNLAIASSELEISKKKVTDLSSQNTKFQKVLEDNNKKLVGIALKDPLTGAFNRRYLDEKLHEEFLKAKRYSQSFILITCDIDHFKKINDSYGHAFGDQVLIKIVQIIKNSIRKTDYIARTGGEEFIVICHSSNELGGIIIAEKIRKIIESSSFVFDGKAVPVSMSFGVANYYPEIKSAEELIRISDDRLYAAKNSGRNRVVYK